MTKTAFPTTEAFKRLVDTPDLWRKTGRPMGQRYRLKSKLKCGLTISLKLRMKLLEDAGFIVTQEAIWQLPDAISPKIAIVGNTKNCKKVS